jgi:hypothetical protein
VRIIGGDLYVGAGQVLTIDGGRINPLNTAAGTITFEGRTLPLGTGAGEYTQVIAPDSITVAQGGTLVVRGRYNPTDGWLGVSEYANVNAPIYVEGTLNIQRGARLTNQVFCYGTGVVNVKSDTAANPVIWDRRTGAEGAYDGIQCFGGGTINIEASASLAAHLYVNVGGILNINVNATLKGDIDVLGTINIKGNFHLDCDPADLVDNPATTEADEALPETHGIFVYNDPTQGAGTLNITGTPAIAGNSGKIHAFAGYPAITGTAADNLFCNHRDASNNACQHWNAVGETWLSQGASRG